MPELCGGRSITSLLRAATRALRWPVHVIASRRGVLDRLVARGFTAGLTPRRPSLSKMHALMPVLLDAFGDGR